MNYISFNGKILSADEPVLLASNRGYRYGDGLFETMKLVNGEILLDSYHFERLFSGLSILQYDIPKLFTEKKIKHEILQLCQKNNCLNLARIRLSVFRGNGGLYDEEQILQYIIESWPLPESVNKLNENGLIIGIYKEIEKNANFFANLKSANFLPYSLAALFAKKNRLNDCLVLNTTGNIADTTIANVFIIKGDRVATPALEEGCVNGVMRRYLIESMKDAGDNIQEEILSKSDIMDADEVFLTNAINGIRWVKQFQNKIYLNIKTTAIYNRFCKTISQ